MNKQEYECADIINEIETKSVNPECCGIYGLMCKSTGKWYVGRSVDIYRRWRDYEALRCKGQAKIYNALSKYTYGGFDKIILETCEAVDWILAYREMYWIRLFSTKDSGYNLTDGGLCGRTSFKPRREIVEDSRERARNYYAANKDSVKIKRMERYNNLKVDYLNRMAAKT